MNDLGRLRLRSWSGVGLGVMYSRCRSVVICGGIGMGWCTAVVTKVMIFNHGCVQSLEEVRIILEIVLKAWKILSRQTDRAEIV